MAPALSIIATAASSLIAGVTNSSSAISSPSTPTSAHHHHNKTHSIGGGAATVTIPIVLPPTTPTCTTYPTASASAMTGSTGPCHPNFQGDPVYIRNSQTGDDWHVQQGGTEGTPVTMQNTSDSSFRLEFTGQLQNDYIIKLNGVPSNGLLVQSYNASSLELCDVLPVDSPSVDIQCETCSLSGSSVGSGCTITDKTSGRYVSQNNQTLGLSESGSDASAQFEFVSASQNA